MLSASFDHKPLLRLRFESGRQACRHLLRAARTPDGHFIPITASELVPKLEAEGFLVTPLDAEALLRDLVADGEAVEIDPLAGYRWHERAA